MDFQTLKNDLGTIFATLQRSTEAGELPTIQDVTRFVALTTKLHMNAPDEWINEAEDFLHLARQLHSSVKHQHVQDAVLLMDALQDAQEFCHRTYQSQA